MSPTCPGPARSIILPKCSKKGDEVEATVLEVDRANQRIALGMKQLEIDPWEKIETL